MRVPILSLLVLLTLFTNAPAQSEPLSWVTLAPEGAGFSILVPAKAVETIDKRRSYTMHTFNITVGKATYAATYSDYEPGKLDPATALTANRDRFLKGLQATLISSREITVSGRNGIEFTSETPAANVKSQMFLVGDRMFQMVTFVFKDVDETRNTDRFFESLKFAPPK